MADSERNAIISNRQVAYHLQQKPAAPALAVQSIVAILERTTPLPDAATVALIDQKIDKMFPIDHDEVLEFLLQNYVLDQASNAEFIRLDNLCSKEIRQIESCNTISCRRKEIPSCRPTFVNGVLILPPET